MTTGGSVAGAAPTHRRFVLCTTPAQGHTAPLVALAGRLITEGHEVVFFTTEHYRATVEATGARFVPLAAEDDAHDLMVANPERESSSKRGVRGVKDDLRRIFIGPLPGQCRDLRAILDEFAADCVVVDSMFFGALPLALGPRADRPALACVGVMPYASNSRDTAPFGVAFQPGTGPLRRLRNTTMNWATEHVALADIQRFARHRLAEAGAPRFGGYLIDLQPKVVDTYLQATIAGFEYPRSDLATTVHFVGPILAPPAPTFEQPPWWDELERGRPVVHVTQGTLDNADLGRLLLVTTRALARDDVLVIATTGGPDPEPLRRGLPANVRLERFVPHHLLLPHVDVMVTNGGYGGVQQALANGVPLVVAGDSEDKPEVAARVQWSGAGVNLHTGRPSPAMVARAVRRVLARPSYRQRAQALQAEIAATDPLATISAALDEVCAANDAVHPRPCEPTHPGTGLGEAGPVTVGAMQAESKSGRLRWQRVNKTPPLPDSFPDSGLLEDLPAAELHRGLFHLLFGRDPAPDDPFVAELENGTTSPRQLMEWLIHSAEWSHSAPMTEFGPSLHYGRGVFIRSLPRARRILDIGGVALGVPYGALVLMGYPYAFKEIVIVDLPSEDRHELYQDGQTQTTVDVAGGRVAYRYHSMTDLSSYPSGSFDMVYSGESIEHITRAEAEQVLAEARRVLKPGGVLALDTPNANLTRLQQDAFIDPDHKYEYRHAEMAAMLRGNGFVIERAMGINYGGDSVARGQFDPSELATKRGIFDDIENCYLLAYVCRKPHRPTMGTSLTRAWWRVAGTQATPRRALGKARRMLAR